MLLALRTLSFKGFIAEFFEKLGYKIRLDVVSKGKRINHGIDTLLNDNMIVERKYHS